MSYINYLERFPTDNPYSLKDVSIIQTEATVPALKALTCDFLVCDKLFRFYYLYYHFPGATFTEQSMTKL